MEWSKKKYNDYYESYMPWIEDNILGWFGENKTSYVAKDKIKQTKITGNDNVDKLQDGVADLVGGQVGKNGIGAPAGDLVSKQGINRTERQGKGESGGIF